jgi:hypothetical protein
VRDGGGAAAYRRGHRFGNWLLTGAMNRIFGGSFADMLSGYRVFSRRFAKSFPATSHGFEIETELSIHALELRMPTSPTRSCSARRQAKLATGTECTTKAIG